MYIKEASTHSDVLIYSGKCIPDIVGYQIWHPCDEMSSLLMTCNQIILILLTNLTYSPSWFSVENNALFLRFSIVGHM